MGKLRVIAEKKSANVVLRVFCDGGEEVVTFFGDRTRFDRRTHRAPRFMQMRAVIKTAPLGVFENIRHRPQNVVAGDVREAEFLKPR